MLLSFSCVFVFLYDFMINVALKYYSEITARANKLKFDRLYRYDGVRSCTCHSFAARTIEIKLK